MDTMVGLSHSHERNLCGDHSQVGNWSTAVGGVWFCNLGTRRDYASHTLGKALRPAASSSDCKSSGLQRGTARFITIFRLERHHGSELDTILLLGFCILSYWQLCDCCRSVAGHDPSGPSVASFNFTISSPSFGRIYCVGHIGGAHATYGMAWVDYSWRGSLFALERL